MHPGEHRSKGSSELAMPALQFGHFLPVSRSETTMVAVGLSPRTESKYTIRRRVATAELSTGTGVFNRRDATRDNVDWSLRGLKSTATFTASLREASRRCRRARQSFPGRFVMRAAAIIHDPIHSRRLVGIRRFFPFG